jgi:hypothetical protein
VIENILQKLSFSSPGRPFLALLQAVDHFFSFNPIDRRRLAFYAGAFQVHCRQNENFGECERTAGLGSDTKHG